MLMYVKAAKEEVLAVGLWSGKKGTFLGKFIEKAEKDSSIIALDSGNKVCYTSTNVKAIKKAAGRFARLTVDVGDNGRVRYYFKSSLYPKETLEVGFHK